MKKCRFCAEEIQDEAKLCKHCGKKQGSSGILWKVAVLFLLLWAVAKFTETVGTVRQQPRAAPTPVPLTPEQQQAQREAAERGLGLRWRYSESEDPMGRGKIRSATVRSANEVEFDFPYKGKQRATLQFRIHPQYGSDVIFRIERGQFLCHDECTVKVRFDEGTVQSYSAVGPSDQSTEMLFLRHYDRFVQNAQKAERISLQATVYQEGEPTFHFNTKGLEW